MPTYHGVCQCRETEWEVTLDKVEHIICHCDVCKTLSGGAYTLNQIIDKSAFKFTKGGDAIKYYAYKGDSGNEVRCYYCPTCTTHPYHHQLVHGPDKIVLRTGLLKERNDFPVACEIYGKARFSWQPEIAKTFDVLP